MTGGSGLLGREIAKLNQGVAAPVHAELDVTDPGSIVRALQKYAPDIVLHLAAATKPPEHEKNSDVGIAVNIIGTANVARACGIAGLRLVYASTDYVYAGPGPHREDEPVTSPYKFGWSKLGGECAVRMLNDFLILRLSFGPVPFPWEKVYENQYNSKLYVDEMAPLALMAAQSGARGVMNLGGPRMSLEDYAKRTRLDLGTIPRPSWVPADTSMDLTRMKRELGIADERALLKHHAE